MWMDGGFAEDIEVTNNTVICAVAGGRSGALFAAYSAERLDHWTVCNNIVTPPSPSPTKIDASHNRCIDLGGVPGGGNFVG